METCVDAWGNAVRRQFLVKVFPTTKESLSNGSPCLVEEHELEEETVWNVDVHSFYLLAVTFPLYLDLGSLMSGF